MLKSVSNLPISRRLFVAFALAALLPITLIAFMGVYYVSQINTRAQVAALTTQAQNKAATLSSNLGSMYNQTKTLERQVLNGLTTNPNVPANTDVASARSATSNLAQGFGQTLTDYVNRYNPTSATMKPVENAANTSHPTDTTSMSENNVLGNLTSDWRTYQADQENELQDLQQIASQVNSLPPSVPVSAKTLQSLRDKIALDSQSLDTAFTQLNVDLSQIMADIVKISGYANEATIDINPVIFGSTIACFLIAIVIICVGFIIHKSINNPLTELVSLTRRIAKGDTNARVQVESRDEIAIVGNSMNNMLDNIVHLIQETQAQRDVLQGQVEKLVSEVSGVGEGDLRVQAEVTADALGVLADSFNYMVEELGSLVVRVKSVARDVEESTTTTSDRMNELVEGADRQLKQIASAANEIEHMAMTSQQVANRALALSSSAREARISAQGGRQAVLQTIEGMGRVSLNVQETSQKVQSLGESSREINNIAEAISTIAHQTHRLALDAAIQAAMAGENGKGFGAVAADIRRLAERAKEQATNVGRIVRGVRDEIGAVAVSMRDTERETAAGAKLAEEAGTSLESIFSVIERQAREIDIINQMAMQQQQSSGNVVQVMQTVSETTQESSSSTHEAAQNMERVARLAEQLLASVEAFKLREGMSYFAPNSTNGLPEENQLTASGSFRTVTATAQPISSSNNGFIALPSPVSEHGFSQFSPSPSFFAQGPNGHQTPFPALEQDHSQSFFPPMDVQSSQPLFSAFDARGGQQFFPPMEQNNGHQFFPEPVPSNGQPFFPAQGSSNGQFFFPPQGSGNNQPFFPAQGANGNPSPFPLPPQGANGGQLPFPAQGTYGSQQPFPPQGNRPPGAPQRPAPNNGWSSSGSENW